MLRRALDAARLHGTVFDSLKLVGFVLVVAGVHSFSPGLAMIVSGLMLILVGTVMKR